MTRWLLNSGWPLSTGPMVKRYYERQLKKIPFYAMIDHLMYKNFLKNTTNVITNEQKSKKFEKQFSHWLYIFMKEKQSTQWNAWQQYLHMMYTAQFCRHNLYTVKLQAWQIHYHISTQIGLVIANHVQELFIVLTWSENFSVIW